MGAFIKRQIPLILYISEDIIVTYYYTYLTLTNMQKNIQITLHNNNDEFIYNEATKDVKDYSVLNTPELFQESLIRDDVELIQEYQDILKIYKHNFSLNSCEYNGEAH